MNQDQNSPEAKAARLIEEMAIDSDQAWVFSEQGAWEEVQNITHSWIKNPEVLRLIRQNADQVSEEMASLISYGLVGLAGFIRTEQVDANRYLQPMDKVKKTEKGEYVERANKRAVFARLEKIALDPDKLSPWTIHNDPIYWAGEFAQDDAVTELKMGYPGNAAVIASEAINETEDELSALRGANADGWANILATQTQNKRLYLAQLKQEDPDSYFLTQKYVGVLSALSTLYLRLGQAKPSAQDVLESLRLQREVQRFVPNQARLSSVAKHGLRAVTFPGSLGTKLELAFTAGKTLTER